MEKEAFEVETLKHIRNRLDYIYSIAKTYNHNHPELMDTIESLAKIANMLAKVKMEELNGKMVTSSPQGYIVNQLGKSYLSMKEYEKQIENKFPDWKL
jgi:hypothetical protein